MNAIIVASWTQYWNLTKPKVVSLIVFTALVGMLLAADGAVPLDVLFFGLIGIPHKYLNIQITSQKIIKCITSNYALLYRSL